MILTYDTDPCHLLVTIGRGRGFSNVTDVHELITVVKKSFGVPDNMNVIEMLETQSPWVFNGLTRSRAPTGRVHSKVALTLFGLACGFLHCSHLVDKECFPADGEWTVDTVEKNASWIDVAVALASDRNWAIQIGANNEHQRTTKLWIDLLAGKDRCGQNQMTADCFVEVFKMPCLFLFAVTPSGQTRLIDAMTKRLQNWFGADVFTAESANAFIENVAAVSISQEEGHGAAEEVAWNELDLDEAKADFVDVLMRHIGVA